jgi:hypothetical protein
MKVCPIQKYGLQATMEHYAETGQVLGKGTHDLEGYELEGKGYFGPGELPVFERNFFSDMPHGTIEEHAFENFKDQAKASGGEITDQMMADLKEEIGRHMAQEYDVVTLMSEENDIDADYI